MTSEAERRAPKVGPGFDWDEELGIDFEINPNAETYKLLREVKELLTHHGDQVEADEKIRPVDRAILGVVSSEYFMTAKQIAKETGYRLKYVQQRLIEQRPLRNRGMIEKRPDHDGYRKTFV